MPQTEPTSMLSTDDTVKRIRSAFKLADRYAVSDIETQAVSLRGPDGTRWYDTRVMLDPREHEPRSLDMAQDAIEYAIERELATRHPEQPHLLRITSKGLSV